MPASPPQWLRSLLIAMHEEIRDAVRDDLGLKEKAFLSGEAHQGAGDVSFQVDVRPEGIVRQAFGRAPEPVVVICEGIGHVTFPAGAVADQAAWWVIIDPLDGSREISYGKRSAWVLSGVAPASPAPTLADITWAIQTEVPPLSQATGVMLTAGSGQAAVSESAGLTAAAAAAAPRELRPSAAESVRGGYAVFTDYFAGSHALTGELADRVFDLALGPVRPGQALAFNDQYLSSAGCMYLMASGTYRFYADLRPVVGELAARSGRNVGLCAHPYDLCTYLIAQQAGVIITDPAGAPLSYPLATDVDCGWVGYANQSIRSEMEGPLLRAISSAQGANCGLSARYRNGNVKVLRPVAQWVEAGRVMAALIGVHGIMNQQSGRHQLIDAWGPALADGLERAAGHAVPVPELDIAFYGDLFLPSRSGKAVKGPADAAAWLTDEDAEALAPFAEEAAGAPGAGPLPDEDMPAKGRTSVPLPLQQAVRALDRRLGSRQASLLFLGELKQVRRYLLDPEIKAAADERAEKAITRGGRVVIAHSLGSVVTFEFIRQHPDYPVDLLLTLGSPLGLRTVRALMPDPGHGADGLPGNVARWVNLRDPRDPVACAGELSGFWPGVCDRTVDNQADAHSVTRYLGKREAGAAVLRALPGLAERSRDDA